MNTDLVIPDSALDWLNVQRVQATNADEYRASVLEDFETVKPYLVKGTVLDIGCGIGGASVLLSRYCGGKIYLLDGNGEKKAHVSKPNVCYPYNDMEVTREMMEANGVTDYEFLPLYCEDLPEVDNCVSFISWCWHYPMKTYSPKAKVIIADMRLEDYVPKQIISMNCRSVKGKGARVLL